MELEQEEPKNVHMGHNVMKFRQFRGMKQSALAQELGVIQQMVSQYEQKKVLPAELLHKISDVLMIPVDVLQNLPDADHSVVIENNNNTFENVEDSVNNIGNNGEIENANTFNPLKEVLKMHKEMMEINRQLLEVEREKVAIFQKMQENKR